MWIRFLKLRSFVSDLSLEKSVVDGQLSVHCCACEISKNKIDFRFLPFPSDKCKCRFQFFFFYDLKLVKY